MKNYKFKRELSPRHKRISKSLLAIRLFKIAAVMFLIGALWQTVQAKEVEENQEEIYTEIISTKIPSSVIIRNTSYLAPQETIEVEVEQSIEEEVIEAPANVQPEIVKASLVATNNVEQIIIDAANRWGIDVNSFYCLAVAESGVLPNNSARNTDKYRTLDRGLYMINDYWHPEVSDSCAYNAECSADWSAMRISQDYGYEWYGYNSNNYANCMINN